MGIGFSKQIGLKCLDGIQVGKIYIYQTFEMKASKNQDFTDMEYLGWAILCFNDQEIFCLDVWPEFTSSTFLPRM